MIDFKMSFQFLFWEKGERKSEFWVYGYDPEPAISIAMKIRREH